MKISKEKICINPWFWESRFQLEKISKENDRLQESEQFFAGTGDNFSHCS